MQAFPAIYLFPDALFFKIVGLYIYGLSTALLIYHSINHMRSSLFAIFLIALVAAIPGDGVEGCEGHESRFQLMDQQPTLEASVPNGKRFTYGKL